MDERFELIIDVQSRGVRATEKEILAAQDALDALNREGKVTEQTMASVSKSLAGMSRALKDGYGQQKQFNAALEVGNKALRERDSLARKQASGADKSLTSAWDAEFKALSQSVTANQKAATERDRASKEAVAGIDRMNSAYDKRIESERKLTRERAAGFQTTRQQMSAWDAEFKALSNVKSAQEQYLNNANSMRYANYDVANTLFAVSAALTAVGIAAASAFAIQERAFTDVQRTAEGSLAGVEDALYRMSTAIPVAFTELSRIATLGNQLGVPADKIVNFTEIVAQFATVTGITADASAQAFGRIGNILGLTVDDYDNLASTVAYVGRTSAATEQQIIGLTERLGASADRAGFTADQVVGLAGALGSLGVAPERAQGVFETYFNTLNESISEGGKRLELFASITGLTADSVSELVRTGQGFEVFQRFLAGVQGADTVQLTTALSELGLTGLRANEVIGRISQRLPLLQKSFEDASGAWAQNTELQRQFALIVDDLASKFQILINALTNAAAAAGAVAAPALKVLLDVVSGLLVNFTDFAQTGFGETFLRVAGNVLIAVAALAALRGVIALATASALAFRTATLFLGGAGIAKGVIGLASALGIYTGATGAATAGTWNLVGAMKAIGKATIILAVLGAVVTALMDVGATAVWAGEVLTNLGNFLESASFLPAAQNGARQIADAGRAVTAWGKQNRLAEDQTYDLNSAVFEGSEAFDDLGDSAGFSADSLGDAGGAAASAAKEVRTLSDYASDLASVWNRAFEIRFSGQSTLDTLTSSFISIREATADSARNIQSLKAEIQGLQSDLSIQQYFLGIAIEYGDAARAQAIQANIAKLQADLSDKTANLSEEQDKNSKTLVGNSKAAINNRKTITDLVTQYQAHIQALAASGLTQDQLAVATERLRQDFIEQATQLGYNRAELDQYEQAFRDVAQVIREIPRNVTVDFNGDAALTAIQEFKARAQAALSSGGGLSVPVSTYGDKTGARQALEAEIEAMRGRLAAAYAATGGNSNIGTTRLEDALSKLLSSLSKVGYATGGFTGAGGKYEPAGIVHRGEYVIPKQYVNQVTGRPNADALGRLQKGSPGRSGYAGGGFVQPRSSGRQTVDLSAMSIQQLAQVMDKFIVVNGKVVANTASSEYATQTAQGSY